LFLNGGLLNDFVVEGKRIIHNQNVREGVLFINVT